MLKYSVKISGKIKYSQDDVKKVRLRIENEISENGNVNELRMLAKFIFIISQI